MNSGLPLSGQMREQRVLNLVNAGIWDPNLNKRQISDALNLQNEEAALDEERLDRQRQTQENVLMAQGMQVEVHNEDDHIVHMHQLRLYQKQPEYMELRRQDPTVDERFEAHFTAHAMAALPPPGVMPQGPGPGPGGPPDTGPPTEETP